MRWLLRGAGLAAIVVAAIYIRLQAVITSVPTPMAVLDDAPTTRQLDI